MEIQVWIPPDILAFVKFYFELDYETILMFKKGKLFEPFLHTGLLHGVDNESVDK